MAVSPPYPISPASITSPDVHFPKKPSIIHQYSELEFSKRDEFRNKLDKDQEAKLLAEEIRISEVRGMFEKHSQKAILLRNVETSLAEWKNSKPEPPEKIGPIKRISSAFRPPAKKKTIRRGSAASQIFQERHRRDENAKYVVEPLREFKAGVMHFKQSESGEGWEGTTYQNKHYSAKFPDQKISMEALLNEESHNPFQCESDKIKYIHIPANHMGWIQRAVERYYGEEGRESNKESTDQLLSREYWKGQLHGSGRNLVHARHMRPRCSHITTPLGMFTQRKQDSTLGQSTAKEPDNSINKPPNFAIFLPYLHWETNRRRKKLAEVVQEATQNNTSKFIQVVDQKSKAKKKTYAQKFDRTDIANPLGRYLYDLAQACEAMNCDADERLIRDGLARKKGQPDLPLHIRRTLDQFYFLTLADTSRRDTDQVVYRQTRTRTESTECEEAPIEPEDPRTHLEHCRLNILRDRRKNAEEQCHCSNQKKSKAKSQEKAKAKPFTRLEGNTRVVMVDQLWMWILDERTIITSFPRRWGVNKHDSSGVHKSLREALGKQKKIRSVYHLALLIIDQCSRVFFDRTQPTDDRPEVMDLFAQAIGTVTDNTTSAYELFWNNVKLQSMGVDDEEGDHKLERRYLNINPEGVLLRESQDIAEELRIMAQIFKQQQSVVKDFRKYIKGHRAEFDHEPKDHSPATRYDQEHNILEKIRRADMIDAADCVEKIGNRKTEIDELEEAATRTTTQLQELLTLKQQQASIVEARAALDRANETVKQGRSIMAFTIVTILFAPLGFIAGVFGMNNSVSTDNDWMTLKEQILYMVVLTACVVLVSLSMAFITRKRMRQISRFFKNSKLSKWVRLHYKMLTWEPDSASDDPLDGGAIVEPNMKPVEWRQPGPKALGTIEQSDTVDGSSEENEKRGIFYLFYFRKRKERSSGRSETV